ncbi:sodium-independent anion transporter, partial [Streptomyces sp. NPDC056454]|uniref:sodium-independent anion transporter n=1 Tax=Streptomyces sp. NPDC056454 TaxID=3345823 RepID=UPI0036C44CD5
HGEEEHALLAEHIVAYRIDGPLFFAGAHRFLPGAHGEEEHALLAEHIVAYRIDGPLFFAGAHRFLLTLSEVADVRVVILRMSRVTTVDASGALMLKDAVHQLNRRGIAVLASGIRPGQRRALESVGALELLRREGREYATTPEAIAGARDRLREAGVLAPGPGPVEAAAAEEAAR